MSQEMEQLEKTLRQTLESFHYVQAQEIPSIDLYMDQVTTFMEERLRRTARHPETDKLLTKTMINNYAKSDLLIPPVKKKYNVDHMLLLLLIYYFKSFLSIGDIQALLAPVRERYAEPPREKRGRGHGGAAQEGAGAPALTLREIYETVRQDMERQSEHIGQDMERQLAAAEQAFAGAQDGERAMLQRFDLICQMSAEVFVKKMMIEKLIDEMNEKTGGK